MTLSRWLRDYLYIPLGGSRGSSLATYRNVILTMVLAGLWHGAGWTFLVWGLLHGAGLGRRARPAGAAEAQGLEPAVPGRLGLIVRRVVTLEFVCLAWVFFRADSRRRGRTGHRADLHRLEHGAVGELAGRPRRGGGDRVPVPARRA